jgi:hypothetical protein
MCPWRLDGLRDGRPGFDSRQDVSFSTTSRPVLGPTQPPIQWLPGSISPGVKTFANYNYVYIMPYLISRVPLFLIESRATPGISANILIYFNYRRAFKMSKWHTDVLVQSVRLGSNEVASDDGRKRPKHVRKIVNMWLSHLKEIL